MKRKQYKCSRCTFVLKKRGDLRCDSCRSFGKNKKVFIANIGRKKDLRKFCGFGNPQYLPKYYYGIKTSSFGISKYQIANEMKISMACVNYYISVKRLKKIYVNRWNVRITDQSYQDFKKWYKPRIKKQKLDSENQSC